ncbi:MAG TPA: helix-turn-helix domain-containing protein [Pseudolysinimonas sp.]|nr:helix-turn-helix domain-containing protein [Pseudolysinimonas sp.]
MTFSTARGGAQELLTREFSEYRAAICDSYVPLQVHSDKPGSFAGRIRMAELNDIHLSEVSAREHSVERTAELIRRGSEQQYFKISLQIAGSGLLIQDNREAVLHPGDISIYDTNRPYSVVCDDDFRMMIAMVPRTLLALPQDAIGQLTAVRFARGHGLTTVVAPFLEQLANRIDLLSGPAGTRLAYNAIDLVSTMLASELGERIQPNARRSLAGRIHAYIEDHLGDPELDPAMIAAAHFISTRQLHGIFQDEGTSVSGWIRTRRLEHCRRDLTDPLLADRPIGALAARWGFIHAAHFSRLYRLTFGISATEERSRIIA